jgi:hypothetical protein
MIMTGLEKTSTPLTDRIFVCKFGVKNVIISDSTD